LALQHHSQIADRTQDPAQSLSRSFAAAKLGVSSGDAEVSLGELTAFYLHPARELLKRSAGLSLTRWSAELDENLPVSVGPLQRWQVGQRLLDARLNGAVTEQAELDARLDGLLPPGEAGGEALSAISADVDRVIGSLPHCLGSNAKRDFTPVDVRTPHGHLIGGIETTVNVVVNVRFGNVKPKQLAAAWFAVLACAATGQPRLGLVRGTKMSVRFRPPDVSLARGILEELLRLRASGLVELLPLPLATAAAFSDPANRNPDLAVRKAWEGDSFNSIVGEADEAWRFFFPTAELDQLRGLPAHPDDPAVRGAGAEGSRFERLATWFWQPVWQHRISSPEFLDALSSTSDGGASTAGGVR
jgi:exodeoxyribonuclease V gamma subunit